MQKNPSFIDMLNNQTSKTQADNAEINEENDSKQVSSFLSNLPRYQSQDLFSQPVAKKFSLQAQPSPTRSHTHSVYVANNKIKQQKHAHPSRMQTERTSEKGDQSMNNISNNRKVESSNYTVRNDELIFQLKLKLVSFMKKFNMDGISTVSGALAEVRDQSIQSILELVFKKFKEYSKEHQNLLKVHNQSMKMKQIQHIKLQTYILTLEETIYEESSRSNRAKEKHKQECSHLQQCLMQRNAEIQQLRQSLYVAESIIKEQNQYIKDMETSLQVKDREIQLQEQIQLLRADLETNNEKNIKLMREIQQIGQENGTLKEENAYINEEINNLMEQNKQYKYETMMSKQKYEKSVIQLEQNQEKLITYFEMYKKQRQNSEDLSAKCKELQTKHKENKKIIQDLQNKVKDLLLQKQAHILVENSLKKQRDSWMSEVKSKQNDIIKLSKNLQQAISTYKNRPTLKKAKTQSNEQNQNDSYTIIISPTKSQKESRKTEEQHQEEIKSVVEQWKSHMLNTVDSYEKIVQNLERELQKKQNQIKHLHFEKAGMQNSNVSTAFSY